MQGHAKAKCEKQFKLKLKIEKRKTFKTLFFVKEKVKQTTTKNTNTKTNF